MRDHRCARGARAVRILPLWGRDRRRPTHTPPVWLHIAPDIIRRGVLTGYCPVIPHPPPACPVIVGIPPETAVQAHTHLPFSLEPRSPASHRCSDGLRVPAFLPGPAVVLGSKCSGAKGCPSMAMPGGDAGPLLGRTARGSVRGQRGLRLCLHGAVAGGLKPEDRHRPVLPPPPPVPPAPCALVDQHPHPLR